MATSELFTTIRDIYDLQECYCFRPTLFSEPTYEREKYTRDLFLGYCGKEVVARMLEDAGYEVFPFGYESQLSVVRRRLQKAKAYKSTPERLRSMPDLLVSETTGGQRRTDSGW